MQPKIAFLVDNFIVLSVITSMSFQLWFYYMFFSNFYARSYRKSNLAESFHGQHRGADFLKLHRSSHIYVIHTSCRILLLSNEPMRKFPSGMSNKLWLHWFQMNVGTVDNVDVSRKSRKCLKFYITRLATTFCLQPPHLLYTNSYHMPSFILWIWILT